MSNENAIVVQRDVTPVLDFTPQQQAMIRDTFANGATQKEFEVLMEVAKARRLNPLLKQIHFVKRWNKQLGRDVWSAQVSIDGLRAIAERTGKYDGQDEPEYERDLNDRIISCRVKVYRKDWSRPAVGVAYWSEYVQTTKDNSPTKFWADMPHVMIAKCAEAIAMRKAFPEDMSGLYVDEEMEQADNREPEPQRPQLVAINPHTAPGEDPAAEEDVDLVTDLSTILENLKADIAAVDSYDRVLELQAILGSKRQQTELLKRLQAGRESGAINATSAASLGKVWQHCFRQLAAKERQLATGPEEALAGDTEGRA